MELKFEYVDDPPPALQEFLWENLKEYSIMKLDNPELKETRSFSIVAKEENEIVGGLLAIIYFKGMNIQCLWVDEQHRTQKLGMSLLEKAEVEAKKSGCNLIYGHTFAFQAPGFYEKAGYEIFGVIENFPPGHKCFFLKKSI